MKTDIISDKWTTRELRAYIREETRNLNNRFNEYYISSTEVNPVVDALKEKLLELGTGIKPDKEISEQQIGLGLTYKTKPELLQQARLLYEAKKVDIYTDEGIKEYNNKEHQQYDTFIQNRPGLSKMTFEEYHDLVEAFGAMGSHVLEEFGYEELAVIYNDAKGVKKLDLVSAVADIKRETKGQGLNQKQLIDKLRDAIIND